VNTMDGMYNGGRKTSHARQTLHAILCSRELTEQARKKLAENTEPSGECLLWTGKRFRSGYGVLTIKAAPLAAHRLAFALATGRVPQAKSHVMHSCDTPHCVNPQHLTEGTAADNVADAISKNRMPPRAKGAASVRARWKECDVLEAAQMRSGGCLLEDIARCFGVSPATVSHALNGRRWPHLKEQVRAIFQT
jgi:hypothetical protein